MYQDVSGPEMARLLTEMSTAPDFALNMIISQTAVVADDIGKDCELLTLLSSIVLFLTLYSFFSN